MYTCMAVSILFLLEVLLEESCYGEVHECRVDQSIRNLDRCIYLLSPSHGAFHNIANTVKKQSEKMPTLSL